MGGHAAADRNRTGRVAAAGTRAAAVATSTLLAGLAAGAAACGFGPVPHDEPAHAQTARSDAGMVVSAEPLATRAGVLMLETGGNAVDAAVAVAFALAVVEPSMSGLGGRTQVLVRTPDGDVIGIDGTAEIPRRFAAAAPDGVSATGYGTIAVPGAVAGLGAAHARFGELPLADVLAPAIALAADGFRLSGAEAARLASVAEDLAGFEGSRGVFLKPDGSPYGEGERLRQPDLARVLRAIAEDGPAVFYDGWIAEAMAADFEANGAFVAGEDLADYAPLDMPTARGRYRGYDIVANSFPASGPSIIQLLHMLEAFDLPAIAGTPVWAALVAAGLRVAVEDRHTVQLPLPEKAALITSPAWAARSASRIALPAVAADPLPERMGLDNTTHVSVADADGMLVALTQSLGPTYGSKVTTPGLGFVYAATLHRSAADARAGLARPILNQSPLMVLRDGRPAFVLGAAGGPRILSSLASVLSRLVDEGRSLEEAVAAPRFHPRAGARIELELDAAPGWSDDERAGFAALGFTVDAMDAQARIHAIHVDPSTGEFVGVADPRRNGSAAAPRNPRAASQP